MNKLKQTTFNKMMEKARTEKPIMSLIKIEMALDSKKVNLLLNNN